MLKVRVIPTLLWKDVGLVKGQKFDSWRRVGPATPAVKVYNRREVDELVFLDVDANQKSDGPDLETVRDMSQHCFVPLTVGGGIQNLESVQHLLRAGADKVAIGSAAYEQPELIDAIARRHGAQCVIASVDVRGEGPGQWRCYSHSGKRQQSVALVQWAKELESRGAGELLLTSIDRDGTMAGYDIALIHTLVHAVNIPVIASGGAGSYQHLVDAVKDAGASAVAAASMFHFTEQTPSGAKQVMSAAGIPIRHPACFQS